MWLIDAIRGWFRHDCRACGRPKPKFTQVCDACWKREEGIIR